MAAGDTDPFIGVIGTRLSKYSVSDFALSSSSVLNKRYDNIQKSRDRRIKSPGVSLALQ